MSVTLIASGRITQPYTLSGTLHKFRVFVRGLAAVGGTWNHNSRTLDANDQVWTDSADALMESISYFLGATVSFGDALLEQYSGGIWIPLATHTPAGTNHASGSVFGGWQGTYIARDVLLHKIRYVIMEGNENVLEHANSLATIGSSGPANCWKQFGPTFTVTNAPYNWAVSRGNQYQNTSPFVGFTNATNRRVRRRRGLT